MGNRLTLKGKDFTSDSLNLGDVGIEYGINSNKTVGYGLSTQIKITGESAKYVEDEYYLNCKNKEKLKGSLFLDKCGGVTIPIVAEKDGTELKPYSCDSTIQVSQYTNEDECYDYLNRTTIKENGFLEWLAKNSDAPKVYYSVQPKPSQYFLFFFRHTLIPILCGLLIIAKLILEVISTFYQLFAIIVQFLSNLLPSNFVDTFNGVTQANLEQYLSFIDSLPSCRDLCEQYDTYVSGSGNYTPTYLFRDIFNFHAQQCGLEFKSSIFNDPNSQYYNAVFWSQDSTRGAWYTDDVDCVEANFPIFTIIELSAMVEKTYCGTECRIQKGQLCFEKKSWYRNQCKYLTNTDELNSLGVEPCFYHEAEDNCAYLDAKYCDDARDLEGNRNNKQNRGYSDSISYDTGEHNRGECEVNSPFGAARFMFDQHSFVKEDILDLDGNIDCWRSGGSFGGILGALSNIPGGFIGLFFDRNCGPVRDCDLLLSEHTASKPKILVLENGYDPDDAKVIKKEFASRDGKKYYYHNYPMYYWNEFTTLVGDDECKELTENFCEEDDPSKTPKMRMKDFQVPLDDDLCMKIITNGIDNYIDTPYGKAVPNKYVLGDCLLSVSDITVFCD